MIQSEITMFLKQLRCVGNILDTEGIEEEFTIDENNFEYKLIKDLEEYKLNY